MIGLKKITDWLGEKGRYLIIMILAGIIGSIICYLIKGIDYLSIGYIIGFSAAGLIECLLWSIY